MGKVGSVAPAWPKHRAPAVGCGRLASSLYGIPISFLSLPPRNPMPDGAHQGSLGTVARGLQRNPSIARHLGSQRQGVDLMLDVIMLALGLGFFALSVGYAYACEWL